MTHTVFSPPAAGGYPLYPQVAQSVRVAGGTVPGPGGYGSSSFLGPNLYLGYVQQLRRQSQVVKSIAAATTFFGCSTLVLVVL